MNYNFEEIAVDQKILIYSFIAKFLVYVLHFFVFNLGLLFYFLVWVVTIVAIYGVYRLCTGLKYSIGLKLLMIIVMFNFLSSLIALIVLSIECTKQLRGAGYEVGLFGVKR